MEKLDTFDMLMLLVVIQLFNIEEKLVTFDILMGLVVIQLFNIEVF
jgi:hypothetical protein